MAAFVLKINGGEHRVDVDPQTPLLWAIRDGAGLMGTKYGCGVAQCGACTVYLDGQPVRSCSMPVSAVGASEITTIEGIKSREAQAQPTRLSSAMCFTSAAMSLPSLRFGSLICSQIWPSDLPCHAISSGARCHCG